MTLLFWCNGSCCLGHCQTVSDFEFTNDPCTYKVFVPTQVEVPTGYVDSAGDNVYMLAIVVMKHIATEMSITEPHPLHVVVSYGYPLVIR